MRWPLFLQEILGVQKSEVLFRDCSSHGDVLLPKSRSVVDVNLLNFSSSTIFLKNNLGFIMNIKLTWKCWIVLMIHPKHRLFLWVVGNPCVLASTVLKYRHWTEKKLHFLLLHTFTIFYTMKDCWFFKRAWKSGWFPLNQNIRYFHLKK